MDKKTIVVLSNITTGLVNFRNELLSILSKNYRVVVIAENTGRTDELLLLGCEFDEIAIDRHGTNPITELKLINLYWKKLKQYSPFVVLAYTIKSNIYGGLVCGKLGIPFIPNITGLGDAIENKGLLSFIAKMLYKMALKKAVMVFFQNQANCNFFINNSIYKGKYKVLPGSGVNLIKHCYENYPTCSNHLVLSVVGRVTKDKGIQEILDASKDYDSKDLTIQLIGDCEGEFLDKINSVSQNGVVKYYGRQENVHEWLRDSHAVLHASYHEGMSNVLLEAAACGRPIIATMVPGCRETFDDGISGIGFAPHNSKSLSEAIKKFRELPYEKKKVMGLAGRKKMEKEFDRQIVVNAYFEEINKWSK